MAINASGAIQLSGSVAGSSIALELGLSANSTVSLGGAGPRGLAGIASGAIRLAQDFYGKSAAVVQGLFFGGWNGSAMTNTVTRINKCGSLIGTNASVGTVRQGHGGGRAGCNAVMWSGQIADFSYTTLTTRIDASGALVGSQTNVGTARRASAGTAQAVGSNAMFAAGSVCCFCGLNSSLVTRVNSSGALVGSQTNATPTRNSAAGAVIGSNAVIYAGCFTFYCICSSSVCYTAINNIRRINACGATVGSATTGGVARAYLAGARAGSVGVYHGGSTPQSGIYQNVATRINACGALVGSQTNVSATRQQQGGAPVCSNALFWGGTINCATTITNSAIRINACGTLVGCVTTAGTAVQCVAGAGF